MAKVIKSLIIGLTAVVTLLGGIAVSGCDKKSTAIDISELMRENFAAEKEAEDDEMEEH